MYTHVKLLLYCVLLEWWLLPAPPSFSRWGSFMSDLYQEGSATLSPYERSLSPKKKQLIHSHSRSWKLNQQVIQVYSVINKYSLKVPSGLNALIFYVPLIVCPSILFASIRIPSFTSRPSGVIDVDSMLNRKLHGITLGCLQDLIKSHWCCHIVAELRIRGRINCAYHKWLFLVKVNLSPRHL